MRWSTSWGLKIDAPGERALGDEVSGRVVLSGGLDRIVEIDGLFEPDIERLRTWAATGSFETTDLTNPLLDRLLALGVIVADPPPTDAPAPVAVIADEPSGEIAEALTARLGSAATGVDDALIAIALRAGAERVAVHREGERNVLHVDLRHRHTLVVGPFEIPGVSACDACYDIRLARRWALPPLPPRPAVLDFQSMIGELIAFHLQRCLETGSHLVNATIAHSMQTGDATTDALLPVPGCKGCGVPRRATGRVRLPWTDSIGSEDGRR